MKEVQEHVLEKKHLAWQEKLFLGIYLLTAVLLFLYTFTQIDLALTLTRLPAWQSIQHAFQYIGYFNRPLSRIIYVAILFLLYALYFILLHLVASKRIRMRTVWILLGITTVLLTVSYNAFSYDIFNYIFDARIVTFYHQNPYIHKALDFPGDPMLGFMRWTHRYYPYGPLWLAFTIPLSFIGLQHFVLTLILFKVFIAASFIGTVYFIGKIVQIVNPEHRFFSMVFFAFNPLVLIECLVSSHNDIVMLFPAVLALYLLIKRKYVWSVLLFVISVGVKFATGFLAPIMGVLYYLSFRRRHIDWNSFLLVSTLIMALAVVVATGKSGNFQPWYLLYILTFASLLAGKFYVFIPSIIMSLFGLLIYVPYLYTGNWDQPTQDVITSLIYLSLITAAVATFAWFGRLKMQKRLR